MNHQKSEAVLKATRLIRTGEVFELGRVLSSTMPLFGTRTFDLHTKRTFMNTAPNRRGSNEELVVTELGQVGTQFDGFTHQTIGDSVYNCVKVDDIATRSGFTRLGIEKVGMVFTRGVLIDVAASKGVEMLARLTRSPSLICNRHWPRQNEPAARRCDSGEYWLGSALGEGQRPVSRTVARNWSRGNGMVGETGSSAHWRRHRPC
jgi:hypothetical protein